MSVSGRGKTGELNQQLVLRGPDSTRRGAFPSLVGRLQRRPAIFFYFLKNQFLQCEGEGIRLRHAVVPLNPGRNILPGANSHLLGGGPPGPSPAASQVNRLLPPEDRD